MKKISLAISLLLFFFCDTMISKPPLKKGMDQVMFQASDFKQNVFFFIDTLYRNLYNRNFGLVKGKAPYEAPPKVTSLDVYLRKEISQPETMQDSLLLYAMASNYQMHYFYKLIPDKHYELFGNEGFIRFDTTIASFDEVAIYLRTEDQSIKKGNYGDTAELWTLKPRNPICKAEDDPERFFLMWRNVYDLDTNMLATLQLSTWRVKNSVDSTLYNGNKNKLISAILGLTRDDGMPLTDNPMIYDKMHAYIIIPPYDNCPTCNEPFNNPELGADYLDSILYRFSYESNEWRAHKSIYYFTISGSN